MIPTSSPSVPPATAPTEPRFARLARLASPRAILAAIAFYLVTLVALFVADLRIAAHAPGVPKPDLVFGYDHLRIMEILTAMGEQGRAAYGVSTVVDTVMPLAFALACILVAARAFARWAPWVYIAPLGFFALDVVENASFLVMLGQFPDVSAPLVGVTRWVTMVKLSAFAVAMPTLVVGVATLLGRAALRRSRSGPA